MDENFLDYKILIEAVQAVETLRGLAQGATTFKERLDLATAAIIEFNKKTAYGLQNTAMAFKSLDEGIAGSTKTSAMFGSESEAGWKRAGEAAQTGTDKIKKGASDATRHISAMRIAWGVLVSTLVSNVLQGITGFVRDSVAQFTQLEDSLWRLVVAEKALSEQGQEISMEDFKAGIQEIRDILPIFSEQDIAGLVGKLAISTKELGYTKEQIIALAKSVAILNVVSTENEDLNQTATKSITALLSGTTKGISGLGVQMNDEVLRAKAVEMQLLKEGEALDKLSKKQKDQVKYKQFIDSANESLGLAGQYLDTNAAKLKENSAAWDDLKTAAGGLVSTLLPAITPILDFITQGINAGKAFLVVLQALNITLFHVMDAWRTGKGLLDSFLKGIDAAKDFPKIFDTIASDLIPSLFAEVPENAPDWFKNIFGKYLQDVDTATKKQEEFNDAVENFDAGGFKKELDDVAEDTKNALDDLETNLTRKQEDLDTEYQRKAADSWTDYQRKLEDINQDSADKITEIKQKFREDDQEREAKYQNELWELQQKYLMDLEDALHERDARQIIRLQKQYALDKESLDRKNNLDAHQSKQQRDIEIKRAQDDAKDKREQARIEYERDLQDQQLAKQREVEDLQLWHQRELQDIQTTQQRKLETLIRGWIEEAKITEANARQVYGILRGYFGPGGLTDQLYDYMMNSLLSNTALPASMSGAPAPYFDLASAQANTPASALGTASGKKKYSPPAWSFPGGLAEGGSFLARTPQSIHVAENGPELVQATPIGRLGADINKMFLQSSGKEGLAGAMEIGVTLSPDLEARVINKSLDSVGDIILKVNRSKI